MRRSNKFAKVLLFVAVATVLGWALLWNYRGPDRLTQEIWEDAIARVEVDAEPDFIGRHGRVKEVTARCDWFAVQTVSVPDVTQDRAEVLAASYERDGWDVTRVVDPLGETFIVFATTPDRSQQVQATFGARSTPAMSLSALHDPGNCPLTPIDGLNYDFDETPKVDTFPT